MDILLWHSSHMKESSNRKEFDCVLVDIIFTIVMTHCFLVNAEIALRLIFHIKVKWAATCSNGSALLRMGWRARRAAGEENALWCPWFVYLIPIWLILLYFSNGTYVYFFVYKRVHFHWENRVSFFQIFRNLLNSLFSFLSLFPILVHTSMYFDFKNKIMHIKLLLFYDPKILLSHTLLM